MKPIHLFLCAAALLLPLSPALFADDAATTQPATSMPHKLYDDVRHSLVAVKYTWESEMASQELVAAGVIVSDDGLIMTSIGFVSPQFIPDGQLKNFKIIIPSDTEDETEVDAVLEGRDERSNVAFIRAATPQKWKAVQYQDAPINVGDKVYSVGLLPRGSGYKAYVTESMVSARLRGPYPQILVSGGLTSVGSPVFNDHGQAIGYVHARGLREAFLDNPQNPADMASVDAPPRLFTPASDFLPSLKDPPTHNKQIIAPWIGTPQLKGLDKEVAEFFDLKNKPAVQVGDVVAGSPADAAGLQVSDIITQFNGQPLERGDLPIELPAILARKIQWLKPGDTIKLSVLHAKGDPTKEIAIKLEPRPKEAFAARRFYAKDLGFVARETVFSDTYVRKLKPDAGGVTIALLRPNAAAQAAKLSVGDLVTQLNGKPVTDLDGFKNDYQKVRKDKPHDPVVLVVSQQDGKEQTINIEPPQAGTVPGEAIEP